MSINRGMDKEDVVHVCNGILLSHKKEQSGSFVVIWMNVESVTQSEVSQKEKSNASAFTPLNCMHPSLQSI